MKYVGCIRIESLLLQTCIRIQLLLTELLKRIKNSDAAFEVMNAWAAQGVAMAMHNLVDAMNLSFEQFHSGVDNVQMAHPLPSAFAPFGQGLKNLASIVQIVLESSIRHGAATAAKTHAASVAITLALTRSLR